MRVLALSQRLPYAPNRGDRLRVFHMIREIASAAEVDVASLVHDREEEDHAVDLRSVAGEVVTARVPRFRNAIRGATALAGSRPLTHLLLDSPHLLPALKSLVRRRRPDVVLVFCSSMAQYMFAPPLSDVPCVLDMIDADSAKWDALAQTGSTSIRWIYRREARLLARFEVRAMQRAFRTLVVNEKERAALLALAPEARVTVVENGVDLAGFAPPGPADPSATVVFCGVMNYEPNVQGARWLAREVWPLVRAARPDARLMLIGASPSPAVTELANEGAGVTVTGTVPEVKPYLWSAAVAAAPLQVARGVQNKVLEAVAAGLPCVVTLPVFEGLPREIEPACRIGGTAQDFAAALLNVLDLPPTERRRLAARGSLGTLQWSNRLQPLVQLAWEAAAARPRTQPGS
jgi:sugar transferase (PEP-CTERM/EpsH1 system associated)